ncbi:MAG: hypothetical protein E7663_01615 [Ruminococcaceae bacterium]|nr:hypothetical protein [Oscillospiraceae bacterium]
MTNILQEIIALLTAGITGIASGIGSGLSNLVQQIFIDTTGDSTKLSIFGGVVVVFAGVSLAIGLSRWVVNWVTSLGASN